MNCKSIPVKAAAAEWRKEPAVLREYETLEREFALAAQLLPGLRGGRAATGGEHS